MPDRRACDGITLTCLLIGALAVAVFCFWKKHPRPAFYFLAGTFLALFIACVYRLGINNYPTTNLVASFGNSGSGSVKADGPVPDIFELLPQCAVALIWVCLPLKKKLNMGVFSGQPPFGGPTNEELLRQIMEQQSNPPPSAYSGHSMDKSAYPMTPQPQRSYPPPQQQQGGW